jgi:MFS superfamily sulfate permease-like transporter
MFKFLKNDLLSGLVVFLVALPLCLGIAHASGAPLFAGIISGVVGGIVVGFFSKSSLSVSGPAAGLVVIMLNAISDLGSFEALLVAIVLAGIIQLAFGFFKAGIVGLYFPSSVIKGMLAAIGLILILKQIPHLIGFDKDAFGEMEFIMEDGSNTLTYFVSALSHVTVGSLIIGLASISVLIIWSLPFIQNNSKLKLVPGALLAVLLGIGLNHFFISGNSPLAIGTEHLVQLPIADSENSIWSFFQFPEWNQLLNFKIYITAFTIAIIASLETLLSIEAVDKLDPLKRRTPQNDELKAQGIGNILCGLLGGLPVTSVIVRSSANVDSGARTKMSAIFHGIILLLTVAMIPKFLNMIPLAALAAILIFVGYKLTKPLLYKKQFQLGRQQFIPFIATIVAILFTDLLIGILIGLSIGIFYILRANHRVTYYYSEDLDEETDKNIITIKLSEHVSFLNKANLQLTLDQLEENSVVIVDGTNSKDIDYDVLEIIYNFEHLAKQKNIILTFKNIPALPTRKKSSLKLKKQ